MPCPTCSHTMACVEMSEVVSAFHCRRCGTLITHAPRDPEKDRRVYVPALVARCRKFAVEEYTAWDAKNHKAVIRPPNRWESLGIAESINLPGDRP